MASQLEYQLEIKIENLARDLDKSLRKIENKLGEAGKKGGKDAGRSAAESFNTSFKANFAADLLSDLFQQGLVLVKDQITDAFTLTMDFEQQISSIKALGGVGEEGQKKIEDLAFSLGSSTKFSALEAAGGMEELLKAGLSLDQVMNGGAQGALDLAAAGSLEVAEAAEIASVAMNAFKKDGLSMTKVADLMAGGANASATNVQGLKMGLSQVSAVASGAGLTFEDTTTALALFAQNGLKGSDAGTSLKTMLLNLNPTTEKASNLMKELGLDFYDASGNVKNMAEIAEELNSSLDHLTNEDRSKALKELFGTDAVRAANILYESGAEDVEKMNEAMGKFTAAEVAAEKTNNLAGAWERFTAALDTIKIKAISKLFPMITPLVEDFAEQLKNIDFEDIKSFFTDPVFVEGMKIVATALGVALALGLIALAKAVWAFSLAWAASPFGMLVLLITGVITILRRLDEEGSIHLEDFANIAVGVAESIGWAFEQLGNAINGVIETVQKASGSVSGLVGNFGKGNTSRSPSVFTRATTSKAGVRGSKEEIAEARENAANLVKNIKNFKIPGFATGTSFAPGGLSLVGERGPELMQMPTGARVFTKEQTENIMNTNIGSNNTSNFYGTSYRSLSSQFSYQS